MSAYTDYLDSLINDSLTKVGVKPSTVMPASTAPTSVQQPAPSPQPAQQGNYNLNFKYTLPQPVPQPPQPSKPSGGGFFGALKDIGGGLGGAVSDVAHLNNPLPSLNTAAQGVGEVFNAGSKYVGLPLAEVLAGSAGNIGGRYSKAKSPLDAIDKVLNAYKTELTTNPITTYRRAVQGGQEMQAEANNAGTKIGGVPVLGTALSLATNPLTFVPGLGAANLAEGAAKVALPAIGATAGGAVAQNVATQAGVPQRYAPLVGLGGSVAGGALGMKPEIAARVPETVGNAAAKAGVVPEGAVPGAGMVKVPEIPTGGVEAPRAGGDVTGSSAPPPQEPPIGGNEPPPNGGSGEPPNGSTPNPTPQPGPLPGTEEVGPLLLPETPTGPKPLSNVDKLYNAVVPPITGGLEREDTARPIMQYRQVAQQVVDSQAKALAAKADYLVNSKDPETGKPVFTFDKQGRITDLVGSPTLQDLAARLPDFEPLLSTAQRAVMAKLQQQVGPWGDLVRSHEIDLGNRTDIKPGGFYLPRGRADVEGADAPVAQGGSGRGKSGYRKTATFDSMMQGIDAGYQYAPLGQALESYVKQAGRDVTDARVANYFKGLTDEEGNPVGTTPHARLLEQNPGIAAKVQGLRQSLQSLKATGARLTAKQQAAIDDFLNNPAPDVEALKNNLDIRVGANAVGKQGPNFGKSPQEINAAIRDVQAKIKNVMPEWKAALDKSRQTPRGQGTIPLNQLQGYSFPDTLAAVATKAIEDSRPIKGRGAPVVRVVNAFNNIFRGLRASADVSFMGIQGLLGAARDPVGYGKAVALAWRSMADPRVLGKYLTEYDAKAAAEGLPDSRTLIASGLHVGGAQSEFAIGGIAGRAERLGTGDTPFVKLNPLRGSNRAFGYFGDAMRLELAKTFTKNASKHGLDVNDPAVLSQLTRAANLSTGWAPNAMGGDIGTMVEFAPRFLQAQISLVADAAKGLAKGPLGKAALNETEARQMLLRLIGAGVTLTIAANEAQGEPLSWRELLDPTYNHGANFMRIRFKGQDISLFGPWDSLVKGVVALGSGDAGYIARSKASPAVSTLWDLATGKTFTGQTATLNFAKDPKAAAEYALRNLVAPFSISDIGQQSPLGTGIGLTGLKSSPLSPTEDLNRVSQLKYGKDYYDLLPTQQQDIQQQYPDLYQRRLEAQTGATAQFRQVKDQLVQQQASLDQAFLDGSITRDQWKSQYDSFNQELAGAGLAIYGNAPITNPKDAQQRYLQIVQENTDPATQIVDWDAVDEGVSQLSQDDQTWIADNQTVGKTPLVAQYKQAQQERQQYNDLPVYSGYTADQARQIDQLVSEARANSRSSDDGAMLSALRRVTAGQSNIDPVILRGARKSIIGVLHQLTVRKRFAATHPLMTAFYGGAGKATNTSLTPQEQALLGGGQ